MITLQKCANAEQKKRWLAPLLNAETRSCFAMTEPDVASSDATNIATTIEPQGGAYVINGRQWFSTGAAPPRLTPHLLMGGTGQAQDRHGARRPPAHSPVGARWGHSRVPRHPSGLR